jgi:hypothetical protein
LRRANTRGRVMGKLSYALMARAAQREARHSNWPASPCLGRTSQGQGYSVRYRSEPDIPSGLNGSGVPQRDMWLRPEPQPWSPRSRVKQDHNRDIRRTPNAAIFKGNACIEPEALIQV